MLVISPDLRIDYPIIDADAHVNEPPDLWQARVPARLRERAPRVVQDECGGDIWVFDTGKARRPLGLTAVAGLSYLQFRNAGFAYETIRPGSFDPAARLADMDLDGIYAQLLYPSVTLAGAATYSDDGELQDACVRAYNEWLAEFCAHKPDRLYGLGIVPTAGIDHAVAELECILEQGHRGAILSAWPNGSLTPDPSDDRFFALAQEADLPLHVHIGSFFAIPSKYTSADGRPYIGQCSINKSGAAAVPVVEELLFSGVLDRFPDLKLVLVESNIGWIPTTLEQTDDMYLRYRFWTGATDLGMLPSEYFYRNVWATFMIDTHGVANRRKCGLDHIMWSTDYPHTGTDWPNSRVTLERNFRGLPYADVKKMLHDNAAQLYRIAEPAGRQPKERVQ
jgi:predicted TIM-barrel fold metal-dependent hydrolase